MIILIIILITLVILIMAEAAYIMPDKMPWNRRKK